MKSTAQQKKDNFIVNVSVTLIYVAFMGWSIYTLIQSPPLTADDKVNMLIIGFIGYILYNRGENK